MNKTNVYSLIDRETKQVRAVQIPTREEARELKNWLKDEHGFDTQIMQETFAKVSERIVR